MSFRVISVSCTVKTEVSDTFSFLDSEIGHRYDDVMMERGKKGVAGTL